MTAREKVHVIRATKDALAEVIRVINAESASTAKTAANDLLSSLRQLEYSLMAQAFDQEQL